MTFKFKAKNHPQQVKKKGALESVDDRETPISIFDPLHGEFNFTLDVAASKENKKCPLYIDRELNGLSVTWITGGSVWCNPPYSDIRPWVAKAIEAVELRHTRRVVMLLPANRTEQGWWQDLVEPIRDGWQPSENANAGVQIETRFLRGRAKFATP